MSESSHKTHADFILPTNVVSKIEISRLVSEVERIDNQMTADTVRSELGAANGEALAYSEQLTHFLDENGLNLNDSYSRSELISELRLLKEQVPVVHMTFATVADPESLQQLVQWLRESVHPHAVIVASLQPALVAGVYIRTPNRVHDLSLRALFHGSRHLLDEELETLRGKQ